MWIEKISRLRFCVDQEKAFHQVDWGFLIRILSSFNFGPDFINWIKLFYNNIESAIVINGWTSSFFSPSHGVQQGCTLSPLLYVLSIEVLAVCLRTSPKLTGITLPNSLEEFRSSGYADDTTVAVTTDDSIEEVFNICRLHQNALVRL